MKEKPSKKKIILITVFIVAVAVLLIVALKMDADRTDESGLSETTVEEAVAVDNGDAEPAPEGDEEEDGVTQPQGPTYATVRISSEDVFVTYNEADYYFFVADSSIHSLDDSITVSAEAVSDSDVANKKSAFNSLDSTEGVSNVTYGEKDIAGYTASTATYVEGGKYYEICFISLDEPMDNIYTAIQINCCAGESAENLEAVNALLDTVTIGAPEPVEVTE